MRDFYWTLDQASLRLETTPEPDLLKVELGRSMPFFAKYRLRVNGADIETVTNPFAWRLKKGRNKLDLAPVDEFGRVGTGSSITVSYGG
jgi:hypothetical protein